MVYLSSLHINSGKHHPYPYDIPTIKFAKHIDLSNRITFIIGENGSGKSALLESLACRLQLPHMEGKLRIFIQTQKNKASLIFKMQL